MSNSRPYPKEIIEFTVEFYEGTRKPRATAIYKMILLLFFIAIPALAIFSVNVSVKSAGQIHAASDASLIRSNSAGFIQEAFIHENSHVKKGQLLFSVRSPLAETKQISLRAKIAGNGEFISDLKKLSATKTETEIDQSFLGTMLYREAWQNFQQGLTERKQKLLKCSNDYERNKKLYQEKVISAVEFENFEYELVKSKLEVTTIFKSHLNTWQQELRNLQKETNDLKAELDLVTKEKDNALIYSPVTGTVQNLAGVYSGTAVFANQDIGQISPDTTLIAEIYVSPADIGLLKINMQVSMQVNAFHFHQWGLLAGVVTEISDDILVRSEQPFFKVKCKLLKDHLLLKKNGYKGMLKKGMTVTCRFLVSRRTLWQLLYDKADNWLNPDVLSAK